MKIRYILAFTFTTAPLTHGISITELLKDDPEVFKIDEYKDLNLNNKGITDLTGLQNIPQKETIRSLKLDENEIDTIRKNSFVGFNSLQVLELRSNRIKIIEPGAFNGLNSLRSLYLAKNKLHTLPYNIFKDTPLLKNLDLSKNKITSLPQSIESLEELSFLTINNNDLVIGGDFSKLTKLHYLDIQDNPVYLGQFTLPYLRVLTVDLNKLFKSTEINAEWYKNFPDLQQLRLGNVSEEQKRLINTIALLYKKFPGFSLSVD